MAAASRDGRGIPREFVKLVSASSGLEIERDDTCAETISDFFNIFAASLTSGATFQKMQPSQQRIAAEKVQQLRPVRTLSPFSLQRPRAPLLGTSYAHVHSLRPNGTTLASPPMVSG